MLCGYYGEHNLGDDALLDVLMKQLPGGTSPLVCAHDEGEIRERYGVATCSRRSLRAVAHALLGCDALVLGGGSLLQDSSSMRSLVYYLLLMGLARLRRIPVVLWAQGLGPLNQSVSRILVAHALRRATTVSWRDSASAAMAMPWTPAARWGPDPVWSMPAGGWEGRGGPIVACLRNTAHLNGNGWRWLLAQLDRLSETTQRQVLWLPFHRDQDGGLLERLLRSPGVPGALASRSHTIHAHSCEAAADAFRGAGLVLAMRLHALILAALCGAPVAALSYDPKVSAAAAAAGLPCWELKESRPDAADSLWMQWRNQLDERRDPERTAALARATEVHQHTLLEGLASP